MLPFSLVLLEPFLTHITANVTWPVSISRRKQYPLFLSQIPKSTYIHNIKFPIKLNRPLFMFSLSGPLRLPKNNNTL